MTVTAIRHATVLTVDAADTVLRDATVVIDGDTITGVLPAGQEPTTPVDHTIDAEGGFVLPGLVNAHAHLAMTIFRGFADDRNLQDFLDLLFPVEARVLREHTVRVGARLAYAESLRAGCTSALDMFWWPEAAADEAHQAGFRLAHRPAQTHQRDAIAHRPVRGDARIGSHRAHSLEGCCRLRRGAPRPAVRVQRKPRPRC